MTEGRADQDAARITEANMRRWDEVFASRAWGRYPPEELVRFIARTFRDPASRTTARVLEIGCGPAPNLWYLLREGFEVAGIDGSPHAIEQARARLASEPLPPAAARADLRVGNFARLPWTDASFDAVIDIEALYSNPPTVIAEALSEVRRVLKPGGWLFSKMFGAETTGVGSGERIAPCTSGDPTDGPLAGSGVVHAPDRDGVTGLFAGFSELKLDWVHRSDANGAYNVFEWLVQARTAPQA